MEFNDHPDGIFVGVMLCFMSRWELPWESVDMGVAPPLLSPFTEIPKEMPELPCLSRCFMLDFTKSAEVRLWPKRFSLLTMMLIP
jgi:hypothetical protein